MLKIISPTGFSDEPLAQMVKSASRGLRGDDRARFQKRASGTLLHDLDAAIEKLASGEELIHLLAIGATEDYSCNRNGDGFRRKVCQQYHPTFVKHARFYRNHRNKDPTQSYGRVLSSGWNSDMNRVELFVGLNGTEKAAEANGNLVADKELEKLAAGKELAVSMACYVPFDVCSWCHNKAATAADYCRGLRQGGHCKAGGLYDNMGSLVEVDGGLHHLHADNTEPKFFDISDVYKPADRIAYVMGLMQKQAGRGPCKSAEAAEAMGMLPPADVLPESDVRFSPLIKIAMYLAELEGCEVVGDAALSSQVSQDLPAGFSAFTEKTATTMAAFGKLGIVLSPEAFATSLGQSPTQAEKTGGAIRAVSRQIYSRLLRSGTLPTYLSNAYHAGVPDAETEKLASLLAPSQSLQPQWLPRRAALAALRGWSPGVKTAAVTPEATELASHYAGYKLSAIEAAVSLGADFALTASLAVRQNYSN